MSRYAPERGDSWGGAVSTILVVAVLGSLGSAATVAGGSAILATDCRGGWTKTGVGSQIPYRGRPVLPGRQACSSEAFLQETPFTIPALCSSWFSLL